MRRRLLLVILTTVISALSIAAVATFIGIKRNDLARTKQSLAQAAQRLASSGQASNGDGLASVKEALRLETVAVLNFVDPVADPTAETSKVGLTPAEVALDSFGRELQVGGIPLAVTDRILPKHLSALVLGNSVTGIVGNRVYAAVRSAKRSTDIDALLLTTELSSSAGQAVNVIALSAIAGLVLAVIAIAVIAPRLVAPLAEVTSAQRRIASGDLSVRVHDRRRSSARQDEIGQLMRDLNIMAESLDRAQKQEQQFLLSVSHDLRTPLTSIRGFAEALAEGAAPDPQRAAAVISAEARRLERLVRDLLELAKLDARRFDLHPRPIDLTDLVTDAADGFLPAAAREGLDLTLDATPDVTATVDPDRLAQVLANLIENALKFARTAVHVSLRVEAARHAQPALRLGAGPTGPAAIGPGTVLIGVGDDGPGIDPEDLPHVFDRLYTSDRRPTRQIGSGLGLTIVRELVEAMHGTVEPATSPAGTTFTVRLPQLPAPTSER